MSCGEDTDQPTVTVFAAASLTDAFTEVGDAFEEATPESNVTFNFAGSQELRTQLEQGASADVFASADYRQMEMAIDSGVIAGEAQEFARNRLVVIVPANNEAGITELEDLARPGLRIAIANSDVPVGNYTREFLAKASADPGFGDAYEDAVLANVVSEEDNVRQVATKVQLDEVDAGVVYSSDVTAELADDVIVIEIPDEFNALASYPIAFTVDGAGGLGEAFIGFVLAEQGQEILERHGFQGVR